MPITVSGGEKSTSQGSGPASIATVRVAVRVMPSKAAIALIENGMDAAMLRVTVLEAVTKRGRVHCILRGSGPVLSRAKGLHGRVISRMAILAESG